MGGQISGSGTGGLLDSCQTVQLRSSEHRSERPLPLHSEMSFRAARVIAIDVHQGKTQLPQTRRWVLLPKVMPVPADSAVLVFAVVALVAVVALIAFMWRFAALQRDFQTRVQQRVNHWRDREMATATKQMESAVRGELATAFQKQLQSDLESWRQRELDQAKANLQSVAQQEAQVALEKWKAEYTTALREDAVQRSYAVTRGKIIEQLVPYLPQFSFNPKDARFLGTPIDFIVFDGLAEDKCDRVVFVEVKTGSSNLSTRERRVRDAIKEKRVEWCQLRLEDEPLPVQNGHSTPLLKPGPVPAGASRLLKNRARHGGFLGLSCHQRHDVEC